MMQKHTEKINETPVVLVGPVGDQYAMASLAVGILKSSLTARGIGSRALYPNLFFYDMLGHELSARIGIGHINPLALERLFAPMAHPEIRPGDAAALDGRGLPAPLERFYDVVKGPVEPCAPDDFIEAAEKAGEFLERIVSMITERSPAVVGFASTFQTTNAILAMAQRVKQLLPGVICVVGGNNCEGPMGEEMAAKFGEIDFVFQGDADFAFADFCEGYLTQGKLPPGRIVRCAPVMDLDRTFSPDYGDFMDQCTVPHEHVTLTFESSRGCWWGHRHQCRFCGESALDIPYRSRRPDAVIDELVEQAGKYPGVGLYFAADSIIPRGYFEAFLPRLKASGFDKRLSYEVKANLDEKKVEALGDAEVRRILAGIESLSTRLLKLLNKGSTALINLRLLRSCREEDVYVVWLLLVGIPGDRISDYREMMRIMPFIQHLAPPPAAPLRIQRSSPYFREGEKHGVSNIAPLGAYARAFPPAVDLSRLGYFFTADYVSESRDDPESMVPFMEALRQWQNAWSEKAPVLSVSPEGPGRWKITDTRECAREASRIIDAETYALLDGFRWGKPSADWTEDSRVAAFLDRGLVIEVDGRLISLVCRTRPE